MEKWYIKLFLIISMFIFIFNTPSFAGQLSLDESGNHSSEIASNRLSSEAFSNSYGSIVFKDSYDFKTNFHGGKQNTFFYKNYYFFGLSIFKLNGNKSKLIDNVKGIPDELPFYNMEINGNYLFLNQGLFDGIKIFDLSKLPSEITEVSSWDGALIKKWNDNDFEQHIEIRGSYFFSAGGTISVYDIKDPSSIVLKTKIQFTVLPQTIGYDIYPIEIKKDILYAVVKHNFYSYVEQESSSSYLYAWKINDDLSFSYLGRYPLITHNLSAGNIQIKNGYVYLTYGITGHQDTRKLSIFRVSKKDGIKKIADIPEVSLFYVSKNRGFGFYVGNVFIPGVGIDQGKSIIKVFDISNPSNLKIIGYLERFTSPFSEGFLGDSPIFSDRYFVTNRNIFKIEALIPSVTAKAKKKKVILRWKSEMEDGIKKYYIRRKLDAENSSSEATSEGKRKWRLKPENKSSKKSKYKIVDKKVKRKTSYIYSLYARDTSGKNTLIKTISLTIP